MTHFANLTGRSLRELARAGTFSAHGFRATASTALHGMGFPSPIIERQLAHADRNATRASYNQAEFMAERQNMMQAWSDWVMSAGAGNVVAIRAA